MASWMNIGGMSPELTYVEETVTENLTPPSDEIRSTAGNVPTVRFWLPPSSSAGSGALSSLERSKTLPAKPASLEDLYGPDFLTFRGVKDDDENGWFTYAVGAALEASRRDVEEENMRMSPEKVPKRSPSQNPIAPPNHWRMKSNVAKAERDLTWRRSSEVEMNQSPPPVRSSFGSPPSPHMDGVSLRRHKSYNNALKKELLGVSAAPGQSESDMLRGLNISPIADLCVDSPPADASRIVAIRNLRPSVEDGPLRLIMERFGPLQDFQRQNGNRSMAVVTYFDVRHACAAMKSLHGRSLFNSIVEMSFHRNDTNLTPAYPNVREAERLFLRSLKSPEPTTNARAVDALFDEEDNYGDVRVEVVTAHPRPIMTRGVSLPRSLFADDLTAKQEAGEMSPTTPTMRKAQKSPSPLPDASRSLSAAWSMGGSTPSKPKFALDLDKVRSGEERRTALMVRNIPNKYSQKMLLKTIEENHRGCFDFFYLPIDFKNKCNVGYAFISFTNPKFIIPFYQEFHGCRWGKFNSEKICEIAFARIQGRANLISHFQNSSLMNEDPKCRPILFREDGTPEEFPVGANVRMRRGPSAREAKAFDRASSCGVPATKLDRNGSSGVASPQRGVPGA